MRTTAILIILAQLLGSANAQACDGDDSNIAGAIATNNIATFGTASSCAGTGGDATCAHTCASGYEGGSITCTGSAFVLAACTAIVCTVPASTTGYTIDTATTCTNLDLSAGAFAPGTVTCAAGYAGASPAAACTTAGEYDLSGCTAITCTVPTDITGYGVAVTGAQLSSALSPTCAAGYAGTPAATCATTGPFALAGCNAIVCTQPSSITGYTITTEGNLDLSTGAFSVTAACASGYTGTAAATACTAAGDYGLGGCTAALCTQPSSITGYTVSAEGNLDLSTGVLDVTAACATGYTGTAVATCTAAGDYALGGCTAIVCTPPASTAGYVVAATDLAQHTITCATSYTGASPASTCATAGAYALGGCSALCTTPASTTGYATPTETTLAATGFAVTVSACATGYEGTPVVAACATPGPYTLSGCAAIVCTQPASIAGYTPTETQLNVATGFAVTAVCATGYTGTAAVAACTTAGPYTLSGCTPVVVPAPAPAPAADDGSFSGSSGTASDGSSDGSGSSTGELTESTTETTTTETTTTVDDPVTHTATVATTVASTGKAPTKAQLQASMLSALPAGSTVVAVLIQTATVPVADPDGTFCGDSAVAGILTISAKGMGKTMTIYGDDAAAPAWDTGCTIAPACAAGRRRRLSHGGSHTVNYATTATDDVSQHVTGASFAASLKSNIQAQATAASVVVTIPTVTVDHSTIEYTNAVTYQITSTTASAVTTTALTGHLTTAVQTSMVSAGFTATEATAMASEAAAAISVTLPSTTSQTTVSGASTAVASATLVAAMISAVVALFSL